jgi:uncharacterized protein (DUF427 family)
MNWCWDLCLSTGETKIDMSERLNRREKESAWDYPRPPRVEPTSRHIRVVFEGVVIADTLRAFRVLETSHPPVYYIPPEDVRREYLFPSPQRTYCEFKGTAHYWTARVASREAVNAAWSYPAPERDYEAIRDYFAFYADLMDACFVDDEKVETQPGGFYGGWITSNIAGPFKGGEDQTSQKN